MQNLLRSSPAMLNTRSVMVVALLLGVGLRLWAFETPSEQAIGETVDLPIFVLVKPELRYLNIIWNDRGYTIECPSRIEHCNQIEAGDRFEVSGTLEAPWYPGWFSRPRLVVSKIVAFQSGDDAARLSFARVVRVLAYVRHRVNLVFMRSLEQPQAGLLAGIVLGERALLSDEFSDALSKTGTMHVIAASGYNVSVITLVSLSLLTLVMPRKASVVVASLFVGAYAILAGGNPAIVRAALMGLIAYAAQFVGREYLVNHALVLTVLCMLLLQPWLINDLSFALSISATWGIIWGTPAIERLAKRIKKKVMSTVSIDSSDTTMPGLTQALIATGFSTTLAATLATLPFSVIVFGQATLIAPLVNALVLWLVSPLMALGGLMAVFGLVSQSLAALLAMLAHPLLSLFIALIELGSRVPMAAIPLSGMHWLVGIGYWLLISSWWHGSDINNLERK